MGRMRSEMSKKNEYWIPSERYLELKHFCRQYIFYMEEARRLSDPNIVAQVIKEARNRKEKICAGSYIERCVAGSIEYEDKCSLINVCAELACPELKLYLITAVSEGLGYEQLKARGIPCGKDYYYNAYHKFFYILDKKQMLMIRK